MNNLTVMDHRFNIFGEINTERDRQDELHPWDNLEVYNSDYLDNPWYEKAATSQKMRNDRNELKGIAYMDHLILEEFYETFAETDPAKQRIEAIQLAALCVRLIEKIDTDNA